MTTWQIVLGLLTIGLSGVTSGVVTFTLNARREDRQFRRQRLEHLYKAFNRFCTQLKVHWMAYIPVMTGKLDYNQGLDADIASGKQPENSLEEIEMLVSIYWPELQIHLDELKLVRDEGSKALGDHKQRYLAGQIQDRQSFDRMGQVGERLTATEMRFRDSVRKAASKFF